jgi:hypothetical protein
MLSLFSLHFPVLTRDLCWERRDAADVHLLFCEECGDAERYWDRRDADDPFKCKERRDDGIRSRDFAERGVAVPSCFD